MRLFLSIIFISIATYLPAQIINGKVPSIDLSKKANDLPIYSFPEVDHELMLEQDEKELNEKEVAMRIAVPFETKIDLIKEGLHSKNKMGADQWILKLDVPGAFGVGVLFDQFHIPEGAELYVFNESKSSVNGAITSENNNDFNFLHVSPVQGSSIYVLYIEPQATAFSGELSIATVTHLYRDLFKSTKGFGDSGSCNINVVCDEGDGWESQVRSVALILNSTGSRICTGALINNTAMDGTQYFLTAKHCTNSNPNVEQWSFIFNYKSEDCTPSVNGLLGNSVFGSELIASSSVTDFALLEINEAIPEGYDVHFSGWTRSSLLISNTTGIHHPSGDVMKISHDEDSPQLFDYLGSSPNNNGNYWRVGDWEEGTTEGGSSGSPLFKNGGKIIGQLRGGWASCSSLTSDFYGAFHLSWDDGDNSSERLKDWLDPLEDDPNSLNGVDLNVIGVEEYDLNGKVEIYPNPTKGHLEIRFETENYIEFVQIVDVSGRVVEIINVNSTIDGIYQLDLTNLKAGFYHLILQSNNASSSKSFVIID